MKISRVITFSLLFLLNSTIHSQWIPVAGNVGYTTPLAIDAIDSNNAIISVRYSINKTSDGGLNWVTLNNPIPGSIPGTSTIVITLSMIDTFHIWIASSSFIFKTTNGGNSWVEQYGDTSKTDYFNYIKMFDLNNGIAIADPKSSNNPALFLRTTDGGENWISVNNANFIGESSGDSWRRLDFPTFDVGYFFPSPYTYIHDNLYKTTDGGSSWGLTNYHTYVNIVKFFNQNIGVAVPGGGSIERTLDGGQTWQNFNIPIQGWATDICFDPSDASRVWLLEDDLFFSSDTGRTWRKESENVQGWDMVMTGSYTGWILGHNNSIFRTTNAGVTFVGVDDEIKSTVNNFELLQNYPNPFNPTTKITYRINYPSNVKLIVYNSMGEQHSILVDAYKNSGEYSVNFNGSGYSSGVYFYQLITQNNVITKKMVLLK